jgi:hypothetical protein
MADCAAVTFLRFANLNPEVFVVPESITRPFVAPVEIESVEVPIDIIPLPPNTRSGIDDDAELLKKERDFRF